MKTDRYTKVVLTLIAVGLFLNIAIHLPVQPAFAASVHEVGTEKNPLVVQFQNTSSFPDLIIHHNGEIQTGLSLD